MSKHRRVTLGLRATTIMGCVAALAPVGCMSGPPVDNPVLIRNAEPIENPVLVSPGQPTAAAYKEVFEKVQNVLTDYFDLQTPNAYDGRITTVPRVAPGYEQVWKSGNPDPRQRLLATLQSIRRTATVTIRTGERGGFLVYVVVDKELEDLARPTQVSIGLPVFQEAPSLNRETEVVTPNLSSESNSTWFKVGRDYALEQEILRRIRQCK